MQHIDDEEYFDMLYLIYEMIGSVDYLAHTCYWSFEDAGYKYTKWFYFNFKGLEVIMNAVLDSGEIANNIIKLVIYFGDLPYKGGPLNASELGHTFGALVASLLDLPRFKDDVNYYKNTDIDKYV